MARELFKTNTMGDRTRANLYYFSSSLEDYDNDMWELEVVNGEHMFTASWAPCPDPHFSGSYRPENELFMSSYDLGKYYRYTSNFEMRVFELLHPEQL